MSREIVDKENRKNLIKELLAELHNGKPFDEVKQKFKQNFENVSASEIADAERALINEEGYAPEDIQKLCDVHASLFDGSVQEIHSQEVIQSGAHPVTVIKEENKALSKLLESIKPYLQAFGLNREALINAFEKLREIDIHYIKKENIIFPIMEKHGITAPPKVMWAVDDEIRELIKQSAEALKSGVFNDKTKELISGTIEKIEDMVSKEDNILVPMIMEVFTDKDWDNIAKEFSAEQYFLIKKPQGGSADEKRQEAAVTDGQINLPTGILSLNQLIAMLNRLPFDITFVDKDDNVKYFSENDERIFPRHRTIIGRAVTNCHPPKSVHVVEQIVKDLKSGAKDYEDFWLKMRDKYVYIRYLAVRDSQGEYLGTLEVTQDIAPIQAITGEKRLMS